MLCPQASDEQATDETMDTVGEAEGGVVGEVEGAHNEQILNDFGLVYVQAVCEIAFIDEPLPEERSVPPSLPLPLLPTPYSALHYRNLCNLAKNVQGE